MLLRIAWPLCWLAAVQSAPSKALVADSKGRLWASGMQDLWYYNSTEHWWFRAKGDIRKQKRLRSLSYFSMVRIDERESGQMHWVFFAIFGGLDSAWQTNDVWLLRACTDLATKKVSYSVETGQFQRVLAISFRLILNGSQQPAEV